MAAGFYITNAVAIIALDAIVDSFDTGTAAVINIYSGSVPADADASIGAATLLAQLVMDATAFGGAADATGKARATAAAIADDAAADASGTASFFRVLTQSGGTVRAQGTVGTSSADLILNTTAIAAGSPVSITAFTIDLPEGP